MRTSSENLTGEREPSTLDGAAAARILLEHAVRGWQAEEERARQLQRRQQLAVAVLLAGTGAFFTAALTLLNDGIGLPFWSGLAFLLFALLFAAAAFTRLIQSKALDGLIHSAQKAGSASRRLMLGSEAAAVDVEDEPSSLRLCFQKTYNAFVDLQRRNDRHEAEIALGTGSLVIALALAFCGVLALLLASGTPEL